MQYDCPMQCAAQPPSGTDAVCQQSQVLLLLQERICTVTGVLHSGWEPSAARSH